MFDWTRLVPLAAAALLLAALALPLNAVLMAACALMLFASEKSCAPSLLNQERRFLEVLGAVRRVELLPTGALLVSGTDGLSLRFFPESSR